MNSERIKQDSKAAEDKKKSPVEHTSRGGGDEMSQDSKGKPVESEDQKESAQSKSATAVIPTDKPIRNHLREIRIENMMSKAELARKAGLSVLTVTRIENGYGCRMDTKRKILKALGLKVSDRRKVFEDD